MLSNDTSFELNKGQKAKKQIHINGNNHAKPRVNGSK